MPDDPSLLAPRFLFRFAAALRYRSALWTPQGLGLEEQYVLPNLAELDGVKAFADVRAAWNEQGLGFAVRVEGKRQPPWCRDSRLEDSDSLQVWIDTRDTHNIHRASRFCHRFVFLPSGGGNRLAEPVAEQVLINRARENANPVRPGVLCVKNEKRVDGYALDCFVPAGALTGFDRDDYPRLGLFYAVIDRELGEQTLAYTAEVPFREDPSVWCTVELAG